MEITTPRRLRSRKVVVHFSSRLPAGDIVTVARIPTTNVSRTLLEIGGVVEEEVLEAALDDALRRRLTSILRLQRRLEEVGSNGRNGVGVLRRLIAARHPKTAPPESVLEARLIRMLRRAQVPEPVRQYEVRERGRVLARVDLAYPDLRVAIEADGYRYHSGRVAWQRDLARRNALTSRGWRVIHVTWMDVVSNSDRVVAEIQRALGEAGR